jgi:VanZ family protein
MSSIPGSNLPSLFPFQDILFHCVVYGLLGFLIMRAFRKSSANVSYGKTLVMTILLGTLYGITDELHQGFVPLRSVSGLDVCIDSVGSLLGGLVYR